MGNLYAYDEKAAYEQRYHSKQSKHTSYSSSSSSSSSCDNEKCDDCNINAPAYTYTFYNTIEEKPLPPLLDNGDGDRRVRFMVEEPLPSLPKNRRSSREAEEAWWANGGQGVYESDEEEEEDHMEDKEKEES